MGSEFPKGIFRDFFLISFSFLFLFSSMLYAGLAILFLLILEERGRL